MKTVIMISLLALGTCIASAAEAVNWREIWDGDKKEWWNKPIAELRSLVDQKNPFAILILADKLYFSDRVQSLELREQAVQYELPQAMVWLAEDVDTPYARRISLISRAAELGYPKAQVDLAIHHFHKNVHPDYDKVLALLRAAADAGEAEGMTALAQLYSAGIGEPRSPLEKPINLLRAAARKEDGSAAEELEKRLRLGIGTEFDLLEAAYFHFRTKAPRTPSPMAAMLRDSELRNDPNKETLKKLDALFEDAFTRRNNTALLELAKLHENGTYGKTNLARACAIESIANSPDAATKIKSLNEEEKKAMERDLKWIRQQVQR
jgi:TPR repeat protein